MKTLKALIMLFTIFNLSVTTYAQDFVKIDTEAYDQSYKLWLEQKRQNALIKIPQKVDFQQLLELLTSNGFGPGNGGNDYIFEVDSIAKDLLTYLENSRELQRKISLKEFEETLQTTSLFFIDNLPKLDERVVDALNWQNGKLILIDRTSWKRKSLEMKYKLIFHEYLGVMGLEINNAFLSNQFELNSFLNGQKRFEMDWSGTTYIYSHSNSNEYALMLDINPHSNKAIITNSYGSSKAKWQERSEKLYIIPTNKIQYDHTTYKYENNVQIIGRTVMTLIDVTVQKTSHEQMMIDETWSQCFISNDPSQTDYNRCEFTIKRHDKSLIYTQDLKSASIELNDNDIVSYPEFTPNGLKQFIVKVSSSKLIFQHGVKEDFKPIDKWSIQNNHLEIKFTNGNSLILTKLKALYGLDRVIARLTTKTNSFIAVTGFVHNSLNDVPLLTQSSVQGHYLPMYINSQHSAEEYPTYIFEKDGTGGFETISSDYSFFNPWHWLIKDNVIITDRYWSLTTQDYIEDKATLSQCIKEKSCFLRNHRKYIPLKVSGHRYTFLRVMEHYSSHEEDVFDDDQGSSFWVMDKI